jgi:hypothetical protein
VPYVSRSRRLALAKEGVALGPGDLNYQITRLLVNYVETNGVNYKAINDIVGALEGAKLEFYRRVASPYEDAKCVENGDVY